MTDPKQAEAQNVPLLTAEMLTDGIAELAGMLDPEESNAELQEALEAIASGDAGTYNTHTHEVVPKGMREAVERAIADLRRRAVSLNPYMSRNSMLDFAERLQRLALNGEKA